VHVTVPDDVERDDDGTGAGRHRGRVLVDLALVEGVHDGDLGPAARPLDRVGHRPQRSGVPAGEMNRRALPGERGVRVTGWMRMPDPTRLSGSAVTVGPSE
jgi:hypothetical protein